MQASKMESLRLRILNCFCSDKPCGFFDVSEYTFEGASTVLESSDKHHSQTKVNMEDAVSLYSTNCRRNRCPS